MGASHSVEPDVPVLDTEDPVPEDTEPEEEVVEEIEDIHWLWPFI